MHGLILTGYMAAPGRSSFRRTAGSHRIATHLREQGWDIEVLDFVMGWSLDQLKEFSKSRVTSKTKFIGFGGTFPIWSQTIEDFFSWFKKTYPDVTVIAGGQISNLYKIKADWYIDGFGERALDALLKHLTGNSEDKLRYQIFANGRKIIKGNLDYPAFPLKSLRIKYEDRDFILPSETLVTELGRGCIFNCKFCNFPILGVKEDHTRDAEDFYTELQDTYDRFGVTSYHLADETVNDYTEKLEKFSRAVNQLNFKPILSGFARADLFASRKHDWDIMMSMGFTGHHYGIESLNPQSLKVVGKGMNPDKLLSGLLEGRAYFKKHGLYKGQVSLIAGLPYETRDSYDQGINWFKQNWISENLIVFPLYIPKDDGRDSVSKLTSEWEDYGYRETTVDLYPKLRELYTRFPTQYGTGESLIDHTGISWENDQWNIADVYKKVIDLYNSKEYQSSFGPPMWSISEWSLALDLPYEFFVGKTIADIKDFLKLEVNLFDFITGKQKPLVDEYIKQKLNYGHRKPSS